MVRNGVLVPTTPSSLISPPHHGEAAGAGEQPPHEWLVHYLVPPELSDLRQTLALFLQPGQSERQWKEAVKPTLQGLAAGSRAAVSLRNLLTEIVAKDSAQSAARIALARWACAQLPRVDGLEGARDQTGALSKGLKDSSSGPLPARPPRPAPPGTAPRRAALHRPPPALGGTAAAAAASPGGDLATAKWLANVINASACGFRVPLPEEKGYSAAFWGEAMCGLAKLDPQDPVTEGLIGKLRATIGDRSASSDQQRLARWALDQIRRRQERNSEFFRAFFPAIATRHVGATDEGSAAFLVRYLEVVVREFFSREGIIEQAHASMLEQLENEAFTLLVETVQRWRAERLPEDVEPEKTQLLDQMFPQVRNELVGRLRAADSPSDHYHLLLDLHTVFRKLATPPSPGAPPSPGLPPGGPPPRGELPALELPPKMETPTLPPRPRLAPGEHAPEQPSLPELGRTREVRPPPIVPQAPGPLPIVRPDLVLVPKPGEGWKDKTEALEHTHAAVMGSRVGGAGGGITEQGVAAKDRVGQLLRERRKAFVETGDVGAWTTLPDNGEADLRKILKEHEISDIVTLLAGPTYGTQFDRPLGEQPAEKQPPVLPPAEVARILARVNLEEVFEKILAEGSVEALGELNKLLAKQRKLFESQGTSRQQSGGSREMPPQAAWVTWVGLQSVEITRFQEAARVRLVGFNREGEATRRKYWDGALGRRGAFVGSLRATHAEHQTAVALAKAQRDGIKTAMADFRAFLGNPHADMMTESPTTWRRDAQESLQALQGLLDRAEAVVRECEEALLDYVKSAPELLRHFDQNQCDEWKRYQKDETAVTRAHYVDSVVEKMQQLARDARGAGAPDDVVESCAQKWKVADFAARLTNTAAVAEQRSVGPGVEYVAAMRGATTAMGDPELKEKAQALFERVVGAAGDAGEGDAEGPRMAQAQAQDSARRFLQEDVEARGRIGADAKARRAAQKYLAEVKRWQRQHESAFQRFMARHADTFGPSVAPTALSDAERAAATSLIEKDREVGRQAMSAWCGLLERQLDNVALEKFNGDPGNTALVESIYHNVAALKVAVDGAGAADARAAGDIPRLVDHLTGSVKQYNQRLRQWQRQRQEEAARRSPAMAGRAGRAAGAETPHLYEVAAFLREHRVGGLRRLFSEKDPGSREGGLPRNGNP